jgi:hypothetical protein
MWWIISLISLFLLAVEALVTTFFVMVALNGFPSLPDALVIIYLVCAGGLLLALSGLAGFLARKLADVSRVPLWLGGILTTLVSLVILPVLMFVLTFGLLAGFGML